MNRRNQMILVACAATILFACGGSDDPGNNGNPSDPTTPDPASHVIAQTYAVSECGGFKTEESRKADDSGQGTKPQPVPGDDPGQAPVSAYCAAERLDYAYDAISGTLKLSNARVMLNCCGEHSVKLEKQADGSYVLREVDAPEIVEIAGQQQPSRCHCMCPFDFSLEAKDIPAGAIELKIVREVTDSDAPAEEIFSGQLDLSQANGSAVVDGEAVIGFCG